MRRLASLRILCAIPLLAAISAAQSPPSQIPPSNPDGHGGSAAAAAGPVDPVFRQILPILRAKTRIPIHLPRHLPDLGQAGDPVYAILEKVTPQSYSIILAFTPDCNGASVCRVGTIAASLAFARRQPAGEPIALARGRRGYYTEAECGANCSDSEVRWREGNTVYTAGVKAGAQAQVVALANASLSPF